MNKCFLTIQWHITEKCNNNCKHCYMIHENKELSKKEILKILNNIDNFEKEWNFEVIEYSITGGDPILSENFEFLLNELSKRKKRIIVLGNPDTLDDNILKLLKKYKVQGFQLSLDGIRERHDYIRKEGSFDLTIEKAKLLLDNNILVNIMFTVNKQNYLDLIPLMEKVAKVGITSFSFDFLCATGNGRNLPTLNSEEVEKLLKEYLKKKEELSKKYNTFFHEKSSLFRKVRSIDKKFNLHEIMTKNKICLGCYIGFNSFAISADGFFMPCRRLGDKYASLLVENLEDIFLGNKELKKYRRANFYKECGKCTFFNFCRGCPAISKYESGNALNKPSICKQMIENDGKIEETSLETTLFEERNIIENHYINFFYNNINEVLRNNKLRDLILLFLFEYSLMENFIKEPENTLKSLNSICSKEEIEMLSFFIELLHMGWMNNYIRTYLFGGKI